MVMAEAPLAANTGWCCQENGVQVMQACRWEKNAQAGIGHAGVKVERKV